MIIGLLVETKQVRYDRKGASIVSYGDKVQLMRNQKIKKNCFGKEKSGGLWIDVVANNGAWTGDRVDVVAIDGAWTGDKVDVVANNGAWTGNRVNIILIYKVKGITLFDIILN